MASGDVFPKMLAVPTMATASGTTTYLFTVPSGRQYTVKQIIICNTDGVDRLINLSFNGFANVASKCFVWQLPIAAYDTIVLDTALVFEATETLGCMADTASKVTVSVTGWDRTL